jgi:CBS domain-containing protein
MSRRVATVEADASVRQAAERMRALAVGALPVMARGRAIGMITDRDLTVRVLARGRAADVTRVREVMTPGVVACFADEELRAAAQQMAREGVRRLVVLDRELEVVGVLSVDDLAMQADDPRLAVKILLRAVERRGVECDGAFPEL